MTNNPLAKLSVQQLKQAVAVREKIDALQKELDRIVGSESSAAKNGAAKRKGKMSAAAKARISKAMKARWAKGKKGRERVSRLAAAKAKARTSSAPLKERIVRSLKVAGKSGVTVKELAARLGKSYGNISVWFHTTAKGVKEIKKIAPGRFAWAP